MPRPKTKKELLALSKENFEKLNALVNSFSKEDQEKEFPKGTLNRNIRDVLSHLHHWHLLFLDWYKIGMKGEKPKIPAAGYTWKTLPAYNKEVRKMYSTKKLDDIRKSLNNSHRTIQKLINQHTDKELFTKKKYKWTGSTSLGSYLVGTTSSHYDWAYKLIKKSNK